LLQNLFDTNGNELDLANKSQRDKSARVIARWINSKSAESCEILNLSRNKITDEGVTGLARALGGNHSIRTLDLSKNNEQKNLYNW